MSYEGVWVKELSDNTGEINNLPVFTRQYKFADVIEFDPMTHRAIRLVRDSGYTPTEIVEYKGRFRNAKAKWEAECYVVEGIGRGKLAVAKKCREEDG